MCTGAEIFFGLSALGGAASQLFGGAPEPPAIEQPAIAADAARDSGATVRVGVTDEVGEEDEREGGITFAPQRTQAQTITGLGRGGLAL
ncbi:hypothetical protein [Stappia phage SI01]|uniref:Uncharacterized protein n=1 Tax=Stappia phage SI01 TaxID=2847766 RepID=A0AAE7SUR4_9CAUD|nr:hypothetical protein [Stappia phage SI01]